MSLLEIKKVRKEYQKGEKSVIALNGGSVSIEKGEFLSIFLQCPAKRGSRRLHAVLPRVIRGNAAAYFRSSDLRA
jgi:hypothetical protein